ncbi:uncharacterized protein LOC141914617 [Tubulanus polymorphus]|uniref:uncharacterized protein LOC141914617 n=1 Tax=Tubulanus polymorphus TaxID=672921 RepID=UPI003DA37BD6
MPLFVSDFGPSAPRVKPEADIYYKRNQGSLKKWFDQNANKQYNSPRPVPKCPSPAAKQQYEKHRGQMNTWLDQSKNRDYNSPRPQPRCPTPAAKDQYNKHQGCMSDLLTGYPSQANTIIIHPRAVKPEAQSNANAHKGNQTKSLFTSYGRLPLSARPVPKIKPEADGNYRKNRGYTTTLFNEYGRLPLSARPAPKVKPEASNNAELDRGGRMSKMLTMAPPSGRNNPMSMSCAF